MNEQLTNKPKVSTSKRKTTKTVKPEQAKQMPKIRSTTMMKKFRHPVTLACCLMLLINSIPLALTINSVLDLNKTFPYLIDRTSGRVIEPRDYMDFDNIYTPNETYKRQQTPQGRNYHLLKAFDFANYYQSDYWHYSNEQELRLSALPVANARRCKQQLDWLELKVNQSDGQGLFQSGQQHVNLMSFMDSFGRAEASTYSGHAHWLGAYHQCITSSIDTRSYELEEGAKDTGNKNLAVDGGQVNVSQVIRGRYCVGKARDVDWPKEKEDNFVPRVSYKIGLCLPESCETLSIRSHRDQIERLMLFNMPNYLQKRLSLRDMYCLPDRRSPIRALSLSSRVFLSLCALWLLALATATWFYSCYRRHQRDLNSMAEQVQQNVDQSSGRAGDSMKQELNEAPVTRVQVVESVVSGEPQAPYLSYVCQPLDIEDEGPNSKALSSGAQLLIIKSQASMTRCKQQQQTRDNSSQLEQDYHSSVSSQFSNRSSLSSVSSAWLQESPLLIRIFKALSIERNMIEFQRPPVLLRLPDADKKLRINLNALDSIKCLCCILVIFGHVVFIHMQHLTNISKTIEVSNEIYPRFLIALFNFVDTFFIISGMLTAYFITKRFNERSFSNPLLWLRISILRLARLSPVYILMFWFAKTLSVHLGEGPLWDYGTDEGSIKGLCINDHWWKSILYLGNWGTMQPLCILPAWSIIVDAQYSLILPPLIYLLLKSKRMGYLGLLVAVAISTTSMSYQLATQTAVKTSDMAKIRLHVYPLISRFAAEFYNTAWNRIGPVAIGILGGHMLYKYDSRQIRRWPWFMRGTPFKFVLLMHLFIFIMPAIGHLTDNPESSHETDMTIFVLSNATIKPIWSLINTIFLLRLVTDLRRSSILASLASHNIWHCLGKLCFPSYLIHYEIILLLLKSRQDGYLDPCWLSLAREFSITFLVSTILSYFVYILFEAPINNLIMMSSSHKRGCQATEGNLAVPHQIRGKGKAASSAAIQLSEDGKTGSDCNNKNNNDNGKFPERNNRIESTNNEQETMRL